MIARVFDIQRFSLHDGDGIRTTVFFSGCPLRCKWCHNPESQSTQDQLMFFKNKCVSCGKCLSVCDARSFSDSIILSREKCTLCGKCIEICPIHANKKVRKEMETAEIIDVVSSDIPFYGNNGGMTLSGGEPSLQNEAALDLIRLAKEKNIGTVVETCGFGKKDFFEKAHRLGVTFYYDLKALDDEKHFELCGVSNKLIIENLLYLFSVNAKVVIRLPLIPGINDTENDLTLLKKFLSENRAKYIRAEIMKYHNLGITKSSALGKEYEMSNENATEKDAERWLKMLNADENKIIISK